jgi:hypothetical protein
MAVLSGEREEGGMNKPASTVKPTTDHEKRYILALRDKIIDD